MESENRNDDNEEGNNWDEDGFIWAPDIFRIISRIMAEGGMRVAFCRVLAATRSHYLQADTADMYIMGRRLGKR